MAELPDEVEKWLAEIHKAVEATFHVDRIYGFTHDDYDNAYASYYALRRWVIALTAERESLRHDYEHAKERGHVYYELMEAAEASFVAHREALRGIEVPRLRVGRKVGRTLYLQVGDAPSDDDPLVGVMDTRELANAVAAALAVDGRDEGQEKEK